ncbi:PPCK2, partial [Symbiodinium necroappetens]
MQTQTEVLRQQTSGSPHVLFEPLPLARRQDSADRTCRCSSASLNAKPRLQFAASAPLKLTNCQWIETSEDLSIDNDTNPAAFASDGNKSSVAIYRSAKRHGMLSLQCEFAEGTARVERIAWSAGLAADCTNESGTLPETKVDGVFLTREEGEKDWSADEATSPAKVESKKLFAYVVLKTPQQKACGENHVARIDELSVFGETVHACNGQLTGRENSEDKQ